MIQYITDLTIVAILVIGLTATIGVLLNGIGERFFGGKTGNESVNHSSNTQTGWKQVGGKRN